MDEKGIELADQIKKLLDDAGYVLFAQPIIKEDGTLGAEAKIAKITPPEEKEEVVG